MGDGARDSESKRLLARKLDAAGWGLFFIWMGVAVLAAVGWGVGLLGVGILTLGAQLARQHFGLRIDRFWLVVGALLFFGAAWELLAVGLHNAAMPGAWVPVSSIAAGVLLLFSALHRRRADRAAR